MDNCKLYDNQEVLHIKWRHFDRWRRFAIPKSGIDYICFLEFLKSVESDFDGRLEYVDDEGDFIRISSSSGITELINCCELMKLNVVYVHSVDDSKK
uniref:PB1 domain-containing protein n=1 Tax=Panagrolaimus sp. ES5 TaxID=591445 RepID=A0AC34FRN9_9BILA